MGIEVLGGTVLRLYASDSSFTHGLASAHMGVGEASVFLEKYLY